MMMLPTRAVMIAPKAAAMVALGDELFELLEDLHPIPSV
jgi:hypothetical protein